MTPMTLMNRRLTILRKSTILGPKGEILNPDPPAGFYMAGICPTCGNPVYYHGGGRGAKAATLTQPAEIHMLEAKVYKLCVCPDTEDFEVRVPKKYDLLTERGSLDTLFSGIHTMGLNYVHMQRTLLGMQEQLEEFMDERSRYLPEEADQGDSGEDYAREPTSSTRASQPQSEDSNGELHIDGCPDGEG